MSKYKVLEAFEIDGVTQEVGTEVELTEAQVAEAGEKVEVIAEDTSANAGGEGEAAAV